MSNKSKKMKLLQRGKYYAKSVNKVCHYCNDGFGCCKTLVSIYFNKDDFNTIFTDKDKVRALLNMNLFTVSLRVEEWTRNEVIIRAKKRSVGKHKKVCVFWNTKGCVLKHDIRPAICRFTTCHNIGKVMERNLSNKKPRYCNLHWSYKEVLTVLQTMDELQLNNKEQINKKDFEKIDWKHVLSVL